MKVTNNPRASAVSLLLRCEKQNSYANLALDAYLNKSDMSEADKRLLTALVYGVIERKISFEHILSHLTTRPMEKIDNRVKIILYTAFYQLMYFDRVPPHAVLNEAVAYTKQLCGQSTATYVNAILRTFLRRGIDLCLYTNTLQGDAYLSVTYSVPRWLVQLWCNAYGLKKAEGILRSTFSKPRLTLCVNTLKISVEAFLIMLRDAGMHEVERTVSPTALLLPSLPLHQIPGFEEGLFYIQDLSCQVAVEALDPKPGDTVLDLCSAPGGKAFKAALMMKNQGEIHAFDLHENRLQPVRNTAETLGISIIRTQQADGKTIRDDLIETGDCVICDVPCSGLGVMAKKPDIRNKKQDEISSLLATQAAILETGALYTKKGGKLMYSTCTLNPEENENITDAFLQNHTDFVRIRDIYPHTIFPDASHDGFFIDVFTKRN
ncbi:MAG TPA: hypothetical protein DER23_00670 [Clostridiales bacterium]|nr:hypothetical protein [Clostridiales bacterium]